MEERQFSNPLTKAEREELKELSLKAYGKSSKWNSLLKKGELIETTKTTSNFDTIRVKTTKYLTINEIYNKMLDIVANKENKNGSSK